MIEPHQFSDACGLDAGQWHAFEASVGTAGSVAGLFQSWRWLQAWTETAAAAFGEQPVIAIGRNETGQIAAILPLARVNKFGHPVLSWLGSAHHNCALPLAAATAFASGSQAEILSVLDAIAGYAGADAIYLTEQPVDGPPGTGRNPLAGPTPIAAPNDCHVLDLADDFERQYNAVFSAKTRSQLRRKMRRLADLSPVALRTAATLDERLAVLDVFFEQKRIQLSGQGAANVFDRPAIRAFYRNLADDREGRRARMDIMALHVGDRVAATVLSMRQGTRVTMLNTSFASDADLADASPGKLLIHAHVTASHASGARTYDFGPGEAAYKSDWHAAPVRLSALVRGVTGRGAAVAMALAAAIRVKRLVKRTPALWSAAQRARRQLARVR